MDCVLFLFFYQSCYLIESSWHCSIYYSIDTKQTSYIFPFEIHPTFIISCISRTLLNKEILVIISSAHNNMRTPCTYYCNLILTSSSFLPINLPTTCIDEVFFIYCCFDTIDNFLFVLIIHYHPITNRYLIGSLNQS